MRLGHFSTPDITTIRVTLESSSFIICSAYLLDITLIVSNPKLLDLFEFSNQLRLKQHKTPSDFHHDVITRLFNKSLNIKNRTKDETRTITHLTTGHSYLRYFQNKICNETSSFCSKCKEEEETTEHFLTRCPAFVLQRYYLFGNFIMTNHSFTSIVTLTNLLNFASSTKYLDFFDPP